MSDRSIRLSRTVHSLPKKNVLISDAIDQLMLKRFLTDHHSRGQLLRYLVVGAWNTLFGYGCFFLLVRLFLRLLPTQPGLAASIALAFATVINVTVSFLGYKWFVFRTQ